MTEIERITFFNGQSLAAEDLNLDQAQSNALRWLHNRTLHDWGIVTGFVVTGRRGDRSVKVAPGIALDAGGRELILNSTVVKPIPVVAGSGKETRFYLVARYVRDSEQKVVESRSGICAKGGAIRLSDDPSIEWRAADQVKEGADLILGTARIANCALSRDVTGESRRTARAATQPHIAAGQTDPATTDWQPWVVGGETVGFSVAVDTKAAGFAETPLYTAHIAGERYLAGAPGPLVAVPLVSVASPQPGKFLLRALLPQGGSGTKINPVKVRNQQEGPTIFKTLGWHVVWMGVEG